ncbi:alpha/beta-tubulin-N-acetyltransferase 9 [Phlebotomus argentipes]|uniref:alpha/beta-tubulin-N-acetyltransferase 9 n=1 Tax=Phlebotomus argentipes TaxID=94469 RepID=UPI002892E454|nr:alpha/beta-tubulin-N-acetyltransferase 9 [Phlebotomus argentipes]
MQVIYDGEFNLALLVGCLLVVRMKQCLKIVSSRVILVPYEENHVPKYHEWMKSPELQEATSSSPLSLEEEYQMQKSWRDDSDKYTFIVLDKNLYRETADEVKSMVGDVNVFLLPNEDETSVPTGEITIMIAEPTARRKGFGLETTLLMMNYCIRSLQIRKFVAIIGEKNSTSVKLFEKLHFREVEKTYFGELKYEKTVEQREWEQLIKSYGLAYEESSYERRRNDA